MIRFLLWSLILSATGIVNSLASSVTLFPEPKAVPCGVVTEMRFSSASEIKIEWPVPKFGPQPMPAGNQKYIEVIFKVTPGRSIGKFDFLLAGQPCLAMAEGEEPYSPLKREVVAESEPKIVKLLFIGNPDEGQFLLQYQYQIPSLPKGPNTITMVNLEAQKTVAPAPAPARKTLKPKKRKTLRSSPSRNRTPSYSTPAQPASKPRPKPTIPADEGW